MGSSRLRVRDPHLERKDCAGLSDRPLPLPTFDVPYFKYIDEEDEDDAWSSRSQSSTEDDSVDSLLSDRYVVVSGTPEKILEHLLNDLHLEDVQDKETGKTGLSPACRLSSGCPCPCVSLGASLPLWPPRGGLTQRLLRAPPPRPRAVLFKSTKWTHGDPSGCRGSSCTKKRRRRQMFLFLGQFLPDLT